MEQSSNNIHLVIERKLNGDEGQLCRRIRSGKRLLLIFEIGAENVITVNAVHRQQAENGQVCSNDNVILLS